MRLKRPAHIPLSANSPTHMTPSLVKKGVKTFRRSAPKDSHCTGNFKRCPHLNIWWSNLFSWHQTWKKDIQESLNKLITKKTTFYNCSQTLNHKERWPDYCSFTRKNSRAGLPWWTVLKKRWVCQTLFDLCAGREKTDLTKPCFYLPDTKIRYLFFMKFIKNRINWIYYVFLFNTFLILLTVLLFPLICIILFLKKIQMRFFTEMRNFFKKQIWRTTQKPSHMDTCCFCGWGNGNSSLNKRNQKSVSQHTGSPFNRYWNR